MTEYRILGPDEAIRGGDQYWSRLDDEWQRSGVPSGRRVRNPRLQYRRPIEYGVWIDWHGGECPVDVNVKVEARLRGGHSGHGLAGEFGWRHHDISTRYDVIAYRVVADDVPEDPPQSVAEGILQGLREFDEALNQMCEGTPAEQRLREVGIEFDEVGDYLKPSGQSGVMDMVQTKTWTPNELEAIAAHMREQEGGAE